MFKRIAIAAIGAAVCLFLCACDTDTQWFEGEKDPLAPMSADQLEKDWYYVKQGTRFYKTFCPDKFKISVNNQDNPHRIIPLVSNEDHIPKQYIGEGLAYSTDKQLDTEIVLERYKDLGYSLGLYNAEFDDSGYLTFKDSSIAEGSELQQLLDEHQAQEYRITAINGIPVDKSIVDVNGGCIVGLEENGLYNVEIYAGTSFVQENIHADTKMLQSFELFYFDRSYFDLADHSYLYFSTPDDLKSGYYVAGGTGIFKYYDHKRGESDDVDMNVSYYETEMDKIVAQSRQFIVHIPSRVRDLAIRVPLNQYYDDGTSSDRVKGYVFSPDGLEYEMQKSEKNNELILQLSQATAGEWTVAVSPKTLNIEEPIIESTKAAEEPTLKSEEFVFAEDEENIVFSATVKTAAKDEEVYGYLVSPTNRTYTLGYEYDDKTETGVLKYELPHVNAGTWTMNIYYHPETAEITDIKQESNVVVDTDVIIIGD